MNILKKITSIFLLALLSTASAQVITYPPKTVTGDLTVSGNIATGTNELDLSTGTWNGQSIVGGGGLTYWVEATNAAATQAGSWLGSTASLVSNGLFVGENGSISRFPPNGGSRGNARGLGAVDLQGTRSLGASPTRVASGLNSVILGGRDNIASGIESAAIVANIATVAGINSAVIASYNGQIGSGAQYSGTIGLYNDFGAGIQGSGWGMFIGGGQGNTITGAVSQAGGAIVGGLNNVIGISPSSVIIGGSGNRLQQYGSQFNNIYQAILGGAENRITGGTSKFNVVVGGIYNTVTGNVQRATIVGGSYNRMEGHVDANIMYDSVILGGVSNTLSKANNSIILQGQSQTLTNDNRALIGNDLEVGNLIYTGTNELDVSAGTWNGEAITGGGGDVYLAGTNYFTGPTNQFTIPSVDVRRAGVTELIISDKPLAPSTSYTNTPVTIRTDVDMGANQFPSVVFQILNSNTNAAFIDEPILVISSKSLDNNGHVVGISPNQILGYDASRNETFVNHPNANNNPYDLGLVMATDDDSAVFSVGVNNNNRPLKIEHSLVGGKAVWFNEDNQLLNFHIAADTASDSILTIENDTTPRVAWNTTEGGVSTTSGNAMDMFMWDQSGGYVFYADGANGRFGIKDSTPSHELDVNGSAQVTTNLYVGGTIYNDALDKLDWVPAGDWSLSIANPMAAGTTTNEYGKIVNIRNADRVTLEEVPLEFMKHPGLSTNIDLIIEGYSAAGTTGLVYFTVQEDGQSAVTSGVYNLSAISITNSQVMIWDNAFSTATTNYRPVSFQFGMVTTNNGTVIDGDMSFVNITIRQQP